MALVILSLSLSCATGIRRLENKPRFQEAIADLERAIGHELDSHQIPSFAIAIVDLDGTVWNRAFGMADPERKVPANTDTVYRVGSVSKLFTDIAIMRLVERRRMELDTPIASYVPEFHPENPFGKDITLRELMSHRSGLVREPPAGNYFDPAAPDLAKTVLSLNSTRLVYEPASRTKYSNAAIGLAGYAVEKLEGTAFADLMQKNVLEPLGMSSSSFTLTDSIRAHLAKGRMWRYDLREFDAPLFQFGFAPAANLYATMPDLARFARMLIRKGEGVLTPGSLEAMWKPQFTDSPEGYGLGFYVDQFEGVRRVRHSGGVYGFSTELLVLPDARLGVCASASMDSANSVVRRIAEYALRLMLAVDAGRTLPSMLLTTPVDPDLARRLDGLYRSEERSVALCERDGRLFLQTDRSLAEVRSAGGRLVADDRHSFGAQISPGEDSIRLDDENFKRVERLRPRPLPEPWKPLIGEYGGDDNILYILEKNGRLYALIEWNEFDPLTEAGQDEFAFPDGSMYEGERLVFRRAPTGQVTEVVAAGVHFPRRAVGPEGGKVFAIKPVRPIAELRREALAVSMPDLAPDALKSDLVEIMRLDPTIRLDIRYAGRNNFMQTPVYSEPRAFLQRPAAEALVRVHRKLKSLGYGLLIHDAYRPWYVTRMFWDATPEQFKIFVANPATGSVHNRGAAVDLTLYDLKTGRPVEMVSTYDEFSDRAFAYYPGGTDLQRWLRRLLRKAMEEEGFAVYPWEWWHFDHGTARQYPVMNVTFDQIR